MEEKDLLTALSALLLQTAKIKDKMFTMPCIFGKQINENFISDWLSFILNPELNGVGYLPLNAMIELARFTPLSENEYADFDYIREKQLAKDARIDILIPVYLKNSKNNNPEYFIAIENKIFADEGEGQTKKYYDYLTNPKSDFYKCNNSEKNIYIFLCVKEGMFPDCDKFKKVTYRSFIGKLQNIPLYFISDVRRAFLFQEFVIHVQEYILEPMQPEITENDCELLKHAKKIIKAYNNNNDIITRAYNDCIRIKNILFSQIYKSIQSKYSNEEHWIIKKSMHNIFVQLYKKKWEEYQIHYEIIIEESKRIPFSGCCLLLMIHYENSQKEEREALAKKLPKSTSKKFEKANFSVYEKEIDTKEAFDTPKKVAELIETISSELSELINATELTIDDFIKSIIDM